MSFIGIAVYYFMDMRIIRYPKTLFFIFCQTLMWVQ